MIESITFRNFKALRDATLPLGPCTVLVGPNGSGKSTVLQALEAVQAPKQWDFSRIVNVGAAEDREAFVEVRLNWGEPHENVHSLTRWHQGRGRSTKTELSGGREEYDNTAIKTAVGRFRVFSLDAAALAAPVQLRPDIELARNGAGLVGVLDRLRDHHLERFEDLNAELARWLPEFDRVGFDLDREGRRLWFLRTRDGRHRIPAADLSQGTLLAVAILTLAYLPEPPSLVGLEEPDRGIHPRLLKHVQEAIYRLSYPESCGETREAVQVLATTHSPYFLDLFRDRPEEIVIANKTGLDVQFQRLSDQPEFEEVLGRAPLGEVWYSGVLGGVPQEQ